MTTSPESQPVRHAELLEDVRRAERPSRRRRVIAGPVGLALLLAGGGMLVRALLLTLQGQEIPVAYPWVFTAAACLLASVALLLITLPKIVPAERGDKAPAPATIG